MAFDPTRDLMITRDVDLPPERLWHGWTEPELLMQWFTPAPWRTIACRIDLRPGGVFATTMQSPEGETFSGEGCFLEVETARRLAWTTVLGPGFRPQSPGEGELPFSATITFEPIPTGTRYTATVVHPDAATRDRHAAYDFHAGWNAALDQLLALMRRT